jgi:hypothetical protein
MQVRGAVVGAEEGSKVFVVVEEEEVDTQD